MTFGPATGGRRPHLPRCPAPPKVAQRTAQWFLASGTDHPGVNEAAPEGDMLMAGLVGRALLVVLETLTPAERLAFVLHDVFGVPFDEIAPVVQLVVGRDPASSRAGHGDGSGRGRRSPALTSPSNGRWSTPSLPPPERATSRRSCGCSIRTSPSGWTAARMRHERSRGDPSSAPRRSQVRRRASGMSASGSRRSSSMALRGCSSDFRL